jgi:hypothetical protein
MDVPNFVSFGVQDKLQRVAFSASTGVAKRYFKNYPCRDEMSTGKRDFSNAPDGCPLTVT